MGLCYAEEPSTFKEEADTAVTNNFFGVRFIATIQKENSPSKRLWRFMITFLKYILTLGYKIIELPKASVESRADFVISDIRAKNFNF